MYVNLANMNFKWVFLHRIIVLPGPCPELCMILERHVMLKAALHSRLAV